MTSFIAVACPQGNVNGSHPLAHRLTRLDLERLVYILSGAYVDELVDTKRERPHAGRAVEDLEPCPLEALRWDDPEMFAEHVASRLEQRRQAVRAGMA